MGSEALSAAGEDGDRSIAQERLRSRNGWIERKFSPVAAELDFVQSKKIKEKNLKRLNGG